MAIIKIIGQNKNLGKNMSLGPCVGHDLVRRELGRIKLWMRQRKPRPSVPVSDACIYLINGLGFCVIAAVS